MPSSCSSMATGSGPNKCGSAGSLRRLVAVGSSGPAKESRILSSLSNCPAASATAGASDAGAPAADTGGDGGSSQSGANESDMLRLMDEKHSDKLSKPDSAR